MIKIGICGKANSGKNTVGDLILDNFTVQKPNFNFENLSFALPVKQMAEKIFPRIPKNYLYGPSKFRSKLIPGAFKNGVPLSVRQLLIDLGTEVGRGYKEDVWIDAFDFAVENAKNNKKDAVIITDLRFLNEFNYLKKNGFYLIKVFRDDQLNINHISENDLDNVKNDQFNLVIDNNGSIDDLREKVNKFLLQIKSVIDV